MVPPFLNSVTRHGALAGPGGILFPKPTLIRKYYNTHAPHYNMISRVTHPTTT